MHKSRPIGSARSVFDLKNRLQNLSFWRIGWELLLNWQILISYHKEACASLPVTKIFYFVDLVRCTFMRIKFFTRWRRYVVRFICAAIEAGYKKRNRKFCYVVKFDIVHSSTAHIILIHMVCGLPTLSFLA